MNWVKSYIAFIVSFLLIDAIWINAVIKPLYQQTLSAIMLEQPRFQAALIFYLIYALAVLYLAVRPNITKGLGAVSIDGAIVGGLAYGTYSVTNYALFSVWTIPLLVSDILWGAFITAICSIIAFHFGRKQQGL